MHKKKERKNDEEQTKLKITIDSLKSQNDELFDKVEGLVKDNIKLSTQLTETSIKLNDNIIGSGDLDMELESKGYDFIINWRNNSELSINNAIVVIEYLNILKECQVLMETDKMTYISEVCLKSGTRKYQNFSLNPFQIGGDSYTFYPNSPNLMNFRVTISTKKKHITQHVVFQNKGNEYLCSKRIYESVNGKLILKSDSKNDLKLEDKYWDENFNTKEFNWYIPKDD